jgi:hypothetical protein
VLLSSAEFHEVPLLQARWYNHDSKILTFGLPEDVSLDLPVCACVLLRGYSAGDPFLKQCTHSSASPSLTMACELRVCMRTHARTHTHYEYTYV